MARKSALRNRMCVHASKFNHQQALFANRSSRIQLYVAASPKSNWDLQYPFPAYSTFPSLQVHGSKELGGTSTAVSPALVHGKAYGVTTATVRLHPL
jgi:hypothetical protein